MLSLAADRRVWLALDATDMRKSFDGLCGIVHRDFDREPHSGDVFVFLNRRRSYVKLLTWDGNGFAIYAKRLERGTFEDLSTTGRGKVLAIGPALQFHCRQQAWAIDGVVDRALRDRFGSQSLTVRAMSKDKVHASSAVDSAGQFRMTLRGPGPFALHTYVHDLAGTEPVFVPADGVAVLRNVFAGDANLVIR